MKSFRRLREKAESVVYRFQMYFYLVLTVALPILFIALVGAATAGVLSYRNRPSLPFGGVSIPWLNGWMASTIGSMDPVSRTVLVGLATLTGIVVLVTVAMRIE